MCLAADGKAAVKGLANSCFCGVASHFLFNRLIVALRCLVGLHTTFDNMKRLGFRSASVSTVGKVGLKNKCSQTTEPQLFYIVCCMLAVILSTVRWGSYTLWQVLVRAWDLCDLPMCMGAKRMAKSIYHRIIFLSPLVYN